MGNSASNANNPSKNPPNRNSSISPAPGGSLKYKKKSLELPDLASLSLTPAGLTPSAARPTTAITRELDMDARVKPVEQAPTKSAAIPIKIPVHDDPFHHYREARGRPYDIEDDSGYYDGRSSKYGKHVPPVPTDEELEEQLMEHTRQAQPWPPRRKSRSRSPTRSQIPSVSAPVSRGRQQQPSRGQQQQQQQQFSRIQDLYERSQQPPSPPRHSHLGGRGKPVYKQEIVHSSIPLLLAEPKKEEEEEEGEVQQYVPEEEDLMADPVPVKIYWTARGRDVILARAGDDEWRGRKQMKRDPVANAWATTVHLRPGTHHIRFIVDGQWRVAEDIPTAVDDQGSLANYVAVPLTYGPSGSPIPTKTMHVPQLPEPPSTRRIVPGQSFWSTSSSADGDDIEVVHSIHTTSPRQQEKERMAAAYMQARWTNVLPPELIEAAKEEEHYLTASAGQYDPTNGNTRITGFVPAPNIPPAPGLPRHLDKLILNSRLGERSKSEGSTGGGSGTTTPAGGSSGVGSGQARKSKRSRREREREKERERENDIERERERQREQERQKERDRGDRERDRDRERRQREKEKERNARANRRADYPPPPPPSEVGDDGPSLPPVPFNSAASLPTLPMQSFSYPPDNESTFHENYTSAPLASYDENPMSSGAASHNDSDKTLGRTNNQNSSGSTVGPLHGTPTNIPGTPTSNTPPNSSLIGMTGTGPIPPHIARQIGTGYTAAAAGSSSSASSPPPPPPPSSSTSTPGASTSLAVPPSSSPVQGPVSGSRAITIDMSDMPLTDDGSVLPVPSHVVLHHLCTSAIRNGVLAVANTTRYKKKSAFKDFYLTTIYYKPTTLGN
ncbi:hypothetical protein CPC08DRAFT_720076 [Agrocybe pediades]|nr:hypothetical protein CPC08DRAFT_720076 [Agrocybe pediades]